MEEVFSLIHDYWQVCLAAIAGVVGGVTIWKGDLIFRRKHQSSKQVIRSGDNSQNYQASGDININPERKRDDVEEK